jgi:tetratricopeptide (TPR) repeat protein
MGRCAALLIVVPALFPAGLAQAQSSTTPAQSSTPPAQSSTAPPPPATPTTCAEGNALLGLGRVSAAEEAYLKELASPDTTGCAKTGLKRIAKDHPCAVASAIKETGETSEARTAYLEFLKAKPSSDCAKTGVTDTSDSSLWEDLATTSADVVKAVGFAALVIGGLAALLLILVNVQARIPGLRSLPPARGIRQPTVSVDSLDDSGLKDIKLGVGTSALLRTRIERGSGGQGLKLVSGEQTTEQTWIDRVAGIGDQAKLAAAVVSALAALLPRRRVKVAGELQPAGSSGPGITLALHRRLAIKGTAALWAVEFGLPTTDQDLVETTRRLVVPAAAWISHSVTTETDGETIGAQDPMSWALFKTGVEWHRDGDLLRARGLYEEAKTRDARNYGARANLALIEAGLGNYAIAIPLLQEALMILET